MTDIETLYTHIQELVNQDIDNLLVDMIDYGVSVSNSNGLLSTGTYVYFEVSKIQYNGNPKIMTNDLGVFDTDTNFISPTIKVTTDTPDSPDFDVEHITNYDDVYYFMCRLPDGTYALYGDTTPLYTYSYEELIEISSNNFDYEPDTVYDANGVEYQAYRYPTYSDGWHVAGL